LPGEVKGQKEEMDLKGIHLCDACESLYKINIDFTQALASFNNVLVLLI